VQAHRGNAAIQPAQQLTESDDRRIALDFIDRLDRAHELLIDALHVLADQTARAAPDAAAIPTARWRLSTASGQRRRLATAIDSALRAMADEPATSNLDRLQAEDAQSRTLSAAHIHRWTMQTIAADWPGYCAASLAIRTAMRRRIAAERAIFHPMLRALALASPR
jgi:hypothetical protein